MPSLQTPGGLIPRSRPSLTYIFNTYPSPQPAAADTASHYPCSAHERPDAGALSHITNSRAWDVLRQWGFVILRGVYGNDNTEWNTLLNLYKAAVMDELYLFGMEDELGPHFQFTIIEDRAALEDVPKNAVRARFLDWVDEQRRAVLADTPQVFDCARFRFFLYIDELCLKAMTVSLRKVRGVESGGV